MNPYAQTRVLILAILIATCSCAKKGGDEPAAAKSIFSLWRPLTSNATLTSLDMSLSHFGSSTFLWTFNSGAKCLSNLSLTGTEASGSYTLSSTTYTGGWSGDPGCSSLDQGGTYSKSGSLLSICSPSCAIYQ